MSMNLYNYNDEINVDCQDCQGCSKCCHNMGDTIALDPFDIYQLWDNMGLTFEEMLGGAIELHMENGLILPNLKMQPFATESSCGFLDANGRCSIHSFRPGLCRLFPIARSYDEDGIHYFLMDKSMCPKTGDGKMAVAEWIGLDSMAQYDQFQLRWHGLKKQMQTKIIEMLRRGADGESKARTASTQFLQFFYIKPYDDDFYVEINRRMSAYEKMTLPLL